MFHVTNQEFLKTLFGADYIWAHVAAFPDDPSNIAPENRMRCWSGGWFKDSNIAAGTNQYFTISTFMADDTGKARRRKALFRCTHVIVADDVREKLDINEVEKLPQPTYKLQTSPGSEQWGWVLDVPCQERHKVENLLDGLVAKGLAPDGKDPGMKGVTRYVRLPEGINSKSSKLVHGVAQRCIVVDWNPDIRVTIDDLARPFRVDLSAERRESRIDGASAVADHPLLKIPEIITIKEVRSDGRFDISCPWVSEHTGGSDDGAAVFTNNDGSIGFKCHHGNCQEKTGKNLLEHIEAHRPGFKAGLETWKVLRSFGLAANGGTDQEGRGTVGGQLEEGQQLLQIGGIQQPTIQDRPSEEPAIDFMGLTGYQDLIDALRRIPLTEPTAILAAYAVLKAVDSLDHGSRLNWWTQVRDHMEWTKPDLQAIIEQQRKEWYPKQESDFYKEWFYVSEQNQFYNPIKRSFLTVEAFANTYSHVDEFVRTEALVNGKTQKVDRYDYVPGMPTVFVEDEVSHINGWTGNIEQGIPGDVSRWLDHFDVLGWAIHKKHILQWMSYTLRHPEKKINHILMLCGGEGNGKDFLLYPLTRAMKCDCRTVEGAELLRDFNDYVVGVKYLHINETELGDHNQSSAITNRLKPIATAPPFTMRVNPKGLKAQSIRNIINVSMSSNSVMPLKLSSDARRYYAVWTTVTIRGADGQVTKEWRLYWQDRWNWIRDCEGWKACVNYIMTQVDLSDFDPGSVPVVTDFLKEIQEASEDPLYSMIKECIGKNFSLLKSDIVRSEDIRSALKSAAIGGISVELKSIPTPNVIGKVMKQHGLGVNTRVWKSKTEFRVWVIRNNERYSAMTGSELYKEYELQMMSAKTQNPLELVANGN